MFFKVQHHALRIPFRREDIVKALALENGKAGGDSRGRGYLQRCRGRESGMLNPTREEARVAIARERLRSRFECQPAVVVINFPPCLPRCTQHDPQR